MSDGLFRWGIISTAKIGREQVLPAIAQSESSVIHAIASRSAETDRLRRADQFTVPSTLALEKATNPFMLATDAKSFAALRAQKDVF